MRSSNDGLKRHLRLVGAQGLSQDLSPDLSPEQFNQSSRHPSPNPSDERPPIEANDTNLVAAFRLDPTSGSQAVWSRYFPVVYRVLARALGPGHEVEDLVQEVFLRLYRKLPSLRDPASLRNFVLAITTRVLQGELRVRWLRRWLRLWDEGESSEPVAIEVDRDAREAIDRLYRILDGLPARHRTAFVLRHIENLELVDVAAALEISLATAKRWLAKSSRRVIAQAKRDPTLAAYVEQTRTPVPTHE